MANSTSHRMSSGKHLSPAHKDGKKLQATQATKPLYHAYIQAGEMEWSEDTDPDAFLLAKKEALKISFVNIRFLNKLGLAMLIDQGKVIAIADSGADWSDWDAEYERLKGLTNKYWSGNRWEYGSEEGGTKARPMHRGLLHSTCTIRPDHALTLLLLSEADRQDLLVKLVELCSATLDAFDPTRCPKVIAAVVHLQESVPHIHLLSATVAPGVLVRDPKVSMAEHNERSNHLLQWPTAGKGGKKGYGNLGASLLAVVRLTSAGLYTGDPYADRYYRNNVRNQRSQHRLAPDLEMGLNCDDLISRVIESSPLLTKRYVEIRPLYIAWLAELRDSSPLNLAHRLEGEIDGLRQQLSDRDCAIIQLHEELAEIRRAVGLQPKSPATDDIGPEGPQPTSTVESVDSPNETETTEDQRDPVKLESDVRTAAVKRLTAEGKVAWLEDGPVGAGRYWVSAEACPAHLIGIGNNPVPDQPEGPPANAEQPHPPEAVGATGPANGDDANAKPVYVADGWKAIPGHAAYKVSGELVYLSLRSAVERGGCKQGVYWIGNGPCPTSLLPAQPSELLEEPPKLPAKLPVGTTVGAPPALPASSEVPATNALSGAATGPVNKKGDASASATASGTPLAIAAPTSAIAPDGDNLKPALMEVSLPGRETPPPSSSMQDVRAISLAEGKSPVVILEVSFTDKEKVKKLAAGRVIWSAEERFWYFDGPAGEFPASLMPYLRLHIPVGYPKPASTRKPLSDPARLHETRAIQWPSVEPSRPPWDNEAQHMVLLRQGVRPETAIRDLQIAGGTHVYLERQSSDAKSTAIWQLLNVKTSLDIPCTYAGMISRIRAPQVVEYSEKISTSHLVQRVEGGTTLAITNMSDDFICVVANKQAMADAQPRPNIAVAIPVPPRSPMIAAPAGGSNTSAPPPGNNPAVCLPPQEVKRQKPDPEIS